MRTTTLACLAVLLLTLTTACTPGGNMTPIEEYADEAEAIGTTLTEIIADVPRDPERPNDSIGGQENGLDTAAEFESTAARLESVLDDLDQHVHAARPHAYFSGNKTAYLHGLERWNTASGEVRTMIRLVRESLHPATSVVPETPGEAR
ncbi:hypothetical protein [Myceligenerans halotolerans]